MYLWLKAFHIVAFISWMAGMLYLPRLFVYHCEADAGSRQSETFKVTLVDNYGGELVHQPKDAADLERFAIGKTFLVGRDPAGYATFSEMPAK